MSKQSGQSKGHNLNPDQLNDLQQRQMSGDEIAATSASVDRSHKIPKHEKHLIHAKMTVGGFNQVTGEPLSKPYVQTFTVEEFRQAEAAQTFAGMKVEILHDPTQTVEDVEPTDFLKPMTTSAPGAGLPLTETLKDIAKKPAKEVAEIYAKAFPDKAEGEKATGKKEQVEELEALLGFLTEEDAERMRSIGENRLKGAEGSAIGAGGQPK